MDDDFLPVTDFELERDKLAVLATQDAWKLDVGLKVRFYKRAELDSFESQKQGRKVFIDKIYVEILMPANRLNVIDREANEVDRRRFFRQFQQFLQSGTQLLVGTPISELPELTASQVMELKALKVETVEQLANMADSTVQLLGLGGMAMKKAAQSFLDKRANSEVLSEQVRSQASEIDRLKAELEKLIAANTAAGTEKASVKVADAQTVSNNT